MYVYVLIKADFAFMTSFSWTFWFGDCNILCDKAEHWYRGLSSDNITDYVTI